MTQWEYLAFARVAGSWADDRYDPRTVGEKLSDAGKDGWELVSVCYDSSGYNFYFKRPVASRKASAASKAKTAKTAKQ